MAIIKWVVDPKKIDILRDIQKYSDEPVISTLVGMFLVSTPVSLEKMKTDLKSNELLNIAKEAHKLKSSCGSLGLTSMAEIFASIEESIKKGSATNLIEALETAELFFGQSKVYLTELK